MVTQDFEKVFITTDGSGAIDKKGPSQWTHWTDAVGYFWNTSTPFQVEKW